jgi:molybdopterin-guanine dinucleotide biosynthesis protein A
MPGLLLIGALSRDAGKTELACRILARHADRRELVGLKVTPVDEGDGCECPRGGAGCGVCGSLEGPFLLTEERAEPPGKDTTRMLAAGARRVFWLRVRRGALQIGLQALGAALGPGALVVAESNTLRAVVDPDLFLMLERPGASEVRPSAEAARGFSDRVVRFDGRGFDLGLEALEIAAGRWRLREPASAIVLAGGRSRRMGRDKASLAIDGVRLLERVAGALRPHVREVLVGAAAGQDVALDGARVVADRASGQGPLMGLASCLATSTSDRNLVAACDLPELPPALLERLLEEALDWEAVVPQGPDGSLEPLLAVYRRRLLPDIERLLAAGERRIRPLFARRQVRYLPLAELGLGALANLNTPEDLAVFEGRL